MVLVPLCSPPVAYYIATWNSFLVFVIVMFTIVEVAMLQHTGGKLQLMSIPVSPDIRQLV